MKDWKGENIMRDILFRGQRFDGVCVEGYFFAKPILEKYFIIIGEDQYMVKRETVGQYTGLTDKNVERIFEGDVLTLDGEDGFFVLEFQEDTARFIMSGDSIVVDFDNFWNYDVEVIGNIHDNPELLKEGGE